ncbi:hypothetical protein EVA_06493 [gut metagenome]|uniref:Uncharacterized protein n=1 Tax=gut metagenome TaxID=749906 RepID=J9GER9_9ZZZZ
MLLVFIIPPEAHLLEFGCHGGSSSFVFILNQNGSRYIIDWSSDFEVSKGTNHTKQHRCHKPRPMNEVTEQEFLDIHFFLRLLRGHIIFIFFHQFNKLFENGY